MLTKNQIRFLKSQAHHLQPVVMIGMQGITENVNKEINLALNSHELIKIKLGNIENALQDEFIRHIRENRQAEFVQKIGHIAIFYRRNQDNPKISTDLPKK